MCSENTVYDILRACNGDFTKFISELKKENFLTQKGLVKSFFGNEIRDAISHSYRFSNKALTRFLIDSNLALDKFDLTYAPESNDLDFVKWVHTYTRIKPSLTGELREACTKGNLKIVNWLLKKGCEYNDYCARDAIIRGHKDIFCSLLNFGCPISEDMRKLAVKEKFVTREEARLF